MRYLILINAPKRNVGGHSISVRDLSTCLTERGHQVDVTVQDDSFLSKILSNNVNRVFIPDWKPISGYRRSIKIIPELIENNNYDALISINIVHTYRTVDFTDLISKTVIKIQRAPA